MILRNDPSMGVRAPDKMTELLNATYTRFSDASVKLWRGVLAHYVRAHYVWQLEIYNNKKIK